jgi:hypothetical protein
MSNWIVEATSARRLSSDATIGEFREKYAFLRLPPLALDAEKDRQRYMWTYELFVLFRSSLVAFLLIIFLYFLFPIFWKNGTLIMNISLYLWPWNSNELNQLGSAGNLSTDAIARLITLNGISSGVWTIWLLTRLRVELSRSDYFILSYKFVFFTLIASLGSWSIATSRLADYFSMIAPSLVDSEFFLSFKNTIWISAAYLMTGMTLFFLVSLCRLSYAKLAGK